MAVRLGVIGTGGISHCHGDGYRQLGDRVEFVACCDLDEQKAKNYANKYGFKKVYTDYKKMLAENKFDAVSVCTWNSAHSPCVIEALNSGANVLCEKPMAMNQEQAKEMEAAAKINNKLLMIGFVRRYGNDADAALDFIKKDYLGEVYYAKASYIRRAGSPGGWFGDKSFSGGGPLIDLGVHVIDLSRYLLGNPKPVTVFGNTFSKLGARQNLKSGAAAWIATTKVAQPVFNVEDMATAFVKFDNGSLLWVETSFSLHTEKENGNIELHGTKAGLRLDPFTLFTETNDMLSTVKIEGPTGFGDFFGNEMAHFISCVEKGVTCMTPGADGSVCRSPAADGVELMKILDAIYKSAATGKSVDIK